jgi:ubiquinone/menaquinone biosynthesis C-methylase UbiE
MFEINPYQNNVKRYDKWFEDNRWVYDAELRAVSSLLVPANQRGIEVSVGTGRFAVPLGIEIGIEPSGSMSGIASERGVKVIGGVAENLPFKDSVFEVVLIVTVICFVNDIYKTFEESFRVLSKGGYLVIGMIDCNSPLGQKYLKHKNDSLFYKQAKFCSVDEILKIMRQTGFDDFDFQQTVFEEISEVTENEIVSNGYGEGLFAVIRGKKKRRTT